MSPATCLAIAE